MPAVEPVAGCAGVGALCCAPEAAFGAHVDVVQLTGQLADPFGPVRALAADGGKAVLPSEKPGFPGGEDDRACVEKLGRFRAVQHGGAALGLNEALGAGCDCDCELQGDAALAGAAGAGENGEGGVRHPVFDKPGDLGRVGAVVGEDVCQGRFGVEQSADFGPGLLPCGVMFRAQAFGYVCACRRGGGGISGGLERGLEDGPGCGVVIAGRQGCLELVVCRGHGIGLEVFGFGCDLRPSVSSLFIHALVPVVGLTRDRGRRPAS